MLTLPLFQNMAVFPTWTITGVIKSSSRDKFYQELGFDYLQQRNWMKRLCNYACFLSFFQSGKHHILITYNLSYFNVLLVIAFGSLLGKVCSNNFLLKLHSAFRNNIKNGPHHRCFRELFYIFRNFFNTCRSIIA